MELEIGEIKVSIQEGEEYYAGLRSLSEKMEQYQDQLSILDSALPKKVYLLQFYNFFPEICSRQGLLCQEMSYTSNPSEESRIQEIPISLSVSGSYSSFINFLNYLQDSVRFFSIESVSLGSSQEDEPFSASLNLKTYSY